MFFSVINIPVSMTLAGLLLSLSACFIALKGDVELALVCLIFSGVCDLFDGFLARKYNKTDQEAQFGLHIDTVVDMASFGVAPIIIAYTLGMGDSLISMMILLFYATCAAVRLCYFNVIGLQKTGNTAFYTGLPVTFIALLFPVFYIVFRAQHEQTFQYSINAFFLIVALLFISKLPVPKPQGVFYLLFPIIALFASVYLVSL